MKKILSCLLISILLAADAGAQECCADMQNIYAKVFGGANFLQNTSIKGNHASYNPGYIFAGSLGYCWLYGLHWEGEYAFRRNGIDTLHFSLGGHSSHGHLQTSSYMANMYWYVPLSSWGCECWDLQPLVGAGLGYDFQLMRATSSRFEFHQKWHAFSWQAIVGLAYTIFCNTELTVEYKFHQGGHFNNHAIGLALTYQFGLK